MKNPKWEFMDEYKAVINKYDLIRLYKLKDKSDLKKWQRYMINELLQEKNDYVKKDKYFRRIKVENDNLILENNDITSILHIYSIKEMSYILYGNKIYLRKDIAKRLIYSITIKYEDILIADIIIIKYDRETDFAEIKIRKTHPGYKLIKNRIQKNFETKKLKNKTSSIPLKVKSNNVVISKKESKIV